MNILFRWLYYTRELNAVTNGDSNLSSEKNLLTHCCKYLINSSKRNWCGFFFFYLPLTNKVLSLETDVNVYSEYKYNKVLSLETDINVYSEYKYASSTLRVKLA